uniref:Uncharacterized protein n=1 Tax=Parascaris equorum TaxID=6256 RepID=A0A914RX75_PAREQ
MVIRDHLVKKVGQDHQDHRVQSDFQVLQDQKEKQDQQDRLVHVSVRIRKW